MKLLDPWNQQLFEMIGRCKAVSAQLRRQPERRQSKSAAVTTTTAAEWQRKDEDQKCAAHIKRTIEESKTQRQSKSAAVITSGSEVNKAKVIHDFLFRKSQIEKVR